MQKEHNHQRKLTCLWNPSTRTPLCSLPFDHVFNSHFHFIFAVHLCRSSLPSTTLVHSPLPLSLQPNHFHKPIHRHDPKRKKYHQQNSPPHSNKLRLILLPNQHPPHSLTALIPNPTFSTLNPPHPTIPNFLLIPSNNLPLSLLPGFPI